MLGAYATRVTSLDIPVRLLNFFQHGLLKCCRISNNDHRQTYGESGERAFRGNTTSQVSFELLKCCRNFKQSSQIDFVSNRKPQVLQRKFSTKRTTVLSRERSLRIQYSCREKRDANFPEMAHRGQPYRVCKLVYYICMYVCSIYMYVCMYVWSSHIAEY